MKERNPIISGLLCGLINCVLQYYLIPNFFMRGIPDAVWVVLMLLLPAVTVVPLRKFGWKPKAVFWGLLTQCVAAVLLCRPIGQMLGFRLESFDRDLFSYIGYGMFAFGWAFGAAAVQFCVHLGITWVQKRK